MGQYYNILTYDEKTKRFDVCDRHIKETEASEPEYTMAKIMEHSWIGNAVMGAFSDSIYGKGNSIRVAWVGDYSDDSVEFEPNKAGLSNMDVRVLYHIAHHSDEYYPLVRKEFDYKGKVLVNWDKKEWVDMDRYIAEASADGWCIHPLSILTSIGNGLGGGDYRGTDMDEVGRWAFDHVSFEDKDKIDLTKFEELGCVFRE